MNNGNNPAPPRGVEPDEAWTAVRSDPEGRDESVPTVAFVPGDARTEVEAQERLRTELNLPFAPTLSYDGQDSPRRLIDRVRSYFARLAMKHP